MTPYRKYNFIWPIKAISKDNEKARGRNGRYYLSQKFKDFEETIRVMFLSQTPPDFEMFKTENLAVSLTYMFKDKRHCDAMNLPKSCLDALNGSLYSDDRQIKEGHVKIIYGDREEIRLEVFNIPSA